MDLGTHYGEPNHPSNLVHNHFIRNHPLVTRQLQTYLNLLIGDAELNFPDSFQRARISCRSLNRFCDYRHLIETFGPTAKPKMMANLRCKQQTERHLYHRCGPSEAVIGPSPS